MSRIKWVGAGIMALILVIGLGIASWQLDWFVAAKNADKTTQIANRNQGTQQALSDEARRSISQYELIDASNTAARGALSAQICSIVPRLRNDYVTPDIARFEAVNC